MLKGIKKTYRNFYTLTPKELSQIISEKIEEEVELLGVEYTGVEFTGEVCSLIKFRGKERNP